MISNFRFAIRAALRRFDEFTVRHDWFITTLLFAALASAVLFSFPAEAQVGGKFIGAGVTPTPTARGLNRDVYIAVRTDGRAGTGTADDPFDGSTAAKFDNAFSNAVSASAFVHLGPGTFLTAGRSTNIFASAGVFKIEGAGLGLTTVKLANNSLVTTNDNPKYLFYHWPGTSLANIELSHMTLDCNAANQPLVDVDKDLSAFVFFTTWGYVHDILAVGMSSGGTETFPLRLWSQGLAKNNQHVFERCRAEPATGYMTVFSMVEVSGGGVSGVFRDCTAICNGTLDAAFGGGGSATLLGGWNGIVIERCRSQGANVGVMIDTGSFTNVIIRQNIFDGGTEGIHAFGDGSFINGIISGNTFQNGQGGSQAITTSFDPLLVEGNVSDYTAFGWPGQSMTPLLVGGTNAALITGLWTNFFTANSNLLNAAVAATPGATFEATQFGTGGGKTNIKSGATLTNTTFVSDVETNGLWLYRPDATANQTKWVMGMSGTGSLVLNPMADDGVTSGAGLTSFRSGTTVTLWRLFSPLDIQSAGLSVGGNLTNAALTASTLVYADANKKLTSASVGAGLDFTAGTLTATGSGAALSALTAATAANTITNADWQQVWKWSLTNAAGPALRITEHSASVGTSAPLVIIDTLAASTAWPLEVKTRGNRVFLIGEEQTQIYAVPGTAVRPTYSFTDDSQGGLWLPGAGILGFSTSGAEAARLTTNNFLLGTTATPTALAKAIALGNSTAPSADPTSGAAIFAPLGELQYRGTNTVEGGGQVNRVHNRAAIVVGAGTDFTCTTSYSRVDFGTTDPEVILPTAGTYAIDAMVGVNINDNGGDVIAYAELFNSTDLAAVAGTERIVCDSAQSFQLKELQIVMHALVTVTASKTIQIYAKGSEAMAFFAARTSIRYIRLY